MNQDCWTKTESAVRETTKSVKAAAQSKDAPETALPRPCGLNVRADGGEHFVKHGFYSSDPAVSTQVTVQLVTTATLTKLGDEGYQAVANVIHKETCTAQNMYLNPVMLGAANDFQVPQSLINIPPAGHVTKRSASRQVRESVELQPQEVCRRNKGGSFASGMRAVLPN